MGYWGYFVVGRGERPLAELDALAGARGMTLRTSAPGGWQLWEYPSGDGGIGSMNDLAGQTGAPALFGYVMDSACVVVEAAAPESGAWTTCLARAVMAGHLGAGPDGGPDGGEQDGVQREGLRLEDYFLEPRDAADRAVEWAAEAGHTVSAEALVEILTAEPGPGPGPVAENLFFHLLDRLGVVPL
ncbi:hypothetical protein ACFYY3_16820 [Streptomyces sp. NPDC001812]|uniref:Uncharacterized protein n=1 Tax=Streptomyces cathayae TaxID=3031124 RepID=A0ABY8K345_9ACTN|nr:hypothetical protein [Streptomyces sp. HUAS 5]WGD41200.1 hypothetical protein PYS65_14120 [Streptomyces sp. HUAS 5]